MTPKYLETLRKFVPDAHSGVETLYPAVIDLDIRLRLMERYPDVLEVVTVSQPPLEELVNSQQAAELARIANDEMADIVMKYPNKFAASAACLPLDDIDASMAETDRAIKELRMCGIQIFTSIGGESLDNPKFKPLWQKMAEYDLPIWIHCCNNKKHGFRMGASDWNYEITTAMNKLINGNVFKDFPNIKFIAHHCGGGMIPFFSLKTYPIPLGFDHLERVRQARNFYADTATVATPALMVGYEFFGADHMVFASDSPLGARYGQTVDAVKQVEQMEIPAEDKEKIFTQNALKLLKFII